MIKIGIVLASLLAIFELTGCSGKVAFSAQPNLAGSTGNNNGATAQILKSIHPVFAVRGMNCIACHGIIGSNVVTDFGFGTNNFSANSGGVSPFFSGARTAFNDVQSSWQSLQVNGTVYVPDVTISASLSNTLFGFTAPTKLVSLMQNPSVPGNTSSMVSGVVPQPGQSAVSGVKSVTIAYPSQAEIVSLLPFSLQNQKVTVLAIAVPGVLQTSSVSGLSADASGNYIKNSNGTVSCYGDVVVKGPLFLNNLKLNTDSNGCRLYVSQSVFIQGPISYSAGVGNLQITSAESVIIGMSAARLGAIQPGVTAGAVSNIRVNSADDNHLTPIGGPWSRMGVDADDEFNPSGENINGVPYHKFFDNIVAESTLIGSQLQDAGDTAAVSAVSSTPGESIATETGDYPGQRVAVTYSGLLLNAPHIHSRYAGNFKGVLIGDVVMLARNPAGAGSIEQFVYDKTFDNVQVILPALSTTILDVKY